MNNLHLPCGGTGYFDESSGYSYRCESCMAVVGSIGQPQRCKDENSLIETEAALSGKNYNYKTGQLQ
jgi:hypothetical protein